MPKTVTQRGRAECLHSNDDQRNHRKSKLTATVPAALGDLPHLASFELTLHRRYRAGGVKRSYLSASCPAPAGFTAGYLTFAKAAYHFADGRTLRTEAVRSCRAR